MVVRSVIPVLVITLVSSPLIVRVVLSIIGGTLKTKEIENLVDRVLKSKIFKRILTLKPYDDSNY